MINVIRSALLFLIILFGLPTFKAIATDASILPQGVTQFLDNDGNPLSTGKVYFYTPNTLTFKTTWQNAAKSVTNTNPVDLDAGGRATIYGDGVYRQIVKDSAGTTIYDAVTTAPLTGSTATLVGDGNLVSTVLPWAGLVAPAQYVFGYGQEIARATYPDFFTATTSSQTVSCTLGSPLITGLADTTQIIVGTDVELSCVAAGTTVLSKTLTTATLSANSSASTTATAVFFPWGNGNGTTTFNVPDLRGYNLAGRDNMGGTASARLVNGNGLGRPLGIANFTYIATAAQTNITTQVLTSGTGATYTAAAGVTKAMVTMCGAGGGGGASTTNVGSAGSADTSFTPSGGSAWTAVKGSGGDTSTTMAGGIGGTGGTVGTGTAIIRLDGSRGAAGAVAGATIRGTGAMGGNSPFGGAGAGGSYTAAGTNAAANSCSGGGAGGGSGSQVSGGGGGSGEYVQFYITTPTTATYTIGTGGAGGAAGDRAGGNGGSGVIIVEEYYAVTPTPVSTSFTDTTAGTLQQVNTINYVVKVTPDTSTSVATGVASLGGMTGVITCGDNLICTSNIIDTVASPTFTGITTTPSIIGGSTATSSLTLTSTAGVGTNDNINFKTGAAQATRWRINTNGTLTGTPITGTVNGFGFLITQALSGSHTNNSWNLINITSDDVNNGDTTFSVGLNVAHSFGGAAMTGGREAIQGIATLTSTSNASNTNRNYVGIQAIGTAIASDGGTNTGAGALGGIFGFSSFGYAQNTATNLLHVTGGEINFALQTGSSAKHKTGLLLTNHTSDAIQGVTTDAGYVLSAQANFGLNHGFLVSDISGFFPIKSTGTIFGSVAGSAANGIDISSVTIATTAFKSTGFSVDGSGNITAPRIITTPTVVNSLPSCAAGLDGARAYVTNNNTATSFGGAVTTGGANRHPVYCDGNATAWKQG